MQIRSLTSLPTAQTTRRQTTPRKCQTKYRNWRLQNTVWILLVKLGPTHNQSNHPHQKEAFPFASRCDYGESNVSPRRRSSPGALCCTVPNLRLRDDSQFSEVTLWNIFLDMRTAECPEITNIPFKNVLPTWLITKTNTVSFLCVKHSYEVLKFGF